MFSETHYGDEADCGGFMPELAHVYPTHTSDDALAIHAINYHLHAHNVFARVNFDESHRLCIQVIRCVGDHSLGFHDNVLNQVLPVLHQSYGHSVTEGLDFVLDTNAAEVL